MLKAFALATRHYVLALQFFTRIPVNGRLAHWVGYSPAMLRASAAHFPGVGVLIGLILGLEAGLLHRLLPAQPMSNIVLAALLCIASVFLTGALHEDGLADVADGLGGGLDRERALLIMKDSRVGAYGAIAVTMALILRVGLLAALACMGQGALLVVLFLAQVSSRAWPLLTIRLLPHVGDIAGSKSKPLADQIGLRALLVASLWCVGAWLACVWIGSSSNRQWMPAHWLGMALSGLLLNAVTWRWLLRWFRQRLQGFTGDCLGATQLIGELAFYLGAVLASGVVDRAV